MFCNDCGKQIEAGAAFCTSCGKSQQQTQSAAPQTGMVAANQSGYHGLLAANDMAQNVKHFDALFTQIAVSENGYIAVYYPYEPATKKSMWSAAAPEIPEKLELFHISQINDFDIDVDGDETTRVSGGAGGAIVGGLLGGAVGSVIGSSLTSGKVKSTTTITDVTLIVNTKDFNNPRVEIPLHRRPRPKQLWRDRYPFALRQYLCAKGVYLSKEGLKIAKEVYGLKNNDDPNIQPNIAQIEELGSTLTQMLAAQQQSELAAAAAPQLSSADELVKFKSLLDSGVITKEEFDAKKKQLLGL